MADEDELAADDEVLVEEPLDEEDLADEEDFTTLETDDDALVVVVDGVEEVEATDDIDETSDAGAVEAKAQRAAGAGAGAGADKAKATGDDEDDDEEEIDPDDVEEDLDQILKERIAASEDEDDEDEVVEVEERGEAAGRVQPKRPGEFVCQSCFLVKHPSQLADEARQLCRDCV